MASGAAPTRDGRREWAALAPQAHCGQPQWAPAGVGIYSRPRELAGRARAGPRGAGGALLSGPTRPLVNRAQLHAIKYYNLCGPQVSVASIAIHIKSTSNDGIVKYSIVTYNRVE